MNGTNTNHAQNTSGRPTKPATPNGPAPAPAAPPPAPPNHTHAPPGQPRPAHNHGPGVNGHRKKKNETTPVDPTTMYESLKNRIAALEEEEVLEEEEERRFGASSAILSADP